MLGKNETQSSAFFAFWRLACLQTSHSPCVFVGNLIRNFTLYLRAIIYIKNYARLIGLKRVHFSCNTNPKL